VWRRPAATATAGEQPDPEAGQEPAATTGFIAAQIAQTKNWFAGLQIQQIWHIVAVLIVLAAAGFGGMDTVEPKPTRFSVNQPHSTGQLTLVVHRAGVKASLGTDRRVVFGPQDGRRYLAVFATVTNDGTVPATFGAFGQTIIPVGIPYRAAYPSGVVRVSDASPAVVQPGATADVIFVWDVPESAVKSISAVNLRVPNRSFGDYRTGYGKGWVDLPTYADIALPVTVAA
jgi:hypothetical protein